MNNIGIILNQDNNQSYLGKFYNRNRLEFPVIRKIYEQIETSKNNGSKNQNLVLTNQNINLEKNNLDVNTNTAIIGNEYVDEIPHDNIINELTNSNNDEIIILDKSYYASIKNNSELSIDTYNLELNTKDTSYINTAINDTPINNKNKKLVNIIPVVDIKSKFNNSELLFLWLSSILLMLSLKYNIFTNIFS